MKQHEPDELLTTGEIAQGTVLPCAKHRRKSGAPGCGGTHRTCKVGNVLDGGFR